MKNATKVDEDADFLNELHKKVVLLEEHGTSSTFGIDNYKIED